MKSTEIATVIKMMETLPDPVQKQVVKHLRSYIEELQDEEDWDRLFEDTMPKLVETAQRARKQIAENLSEPFDETRL